MAEPRDLVQLQALIAAGGPRGLICRGLGRAYGDAAQNAGGSVVSMLGIDQTVDVGWDTGIATLDAGLSIDQLLRITVPRGWFVPVTPGTRQVTIGGALAADIHGKNHHRVGTFGQHVLGFDLLTADGVVRHVTPQSDTDLFWATAGGMGLTGAILRVQLRLRRVGSAYMEVETARGRDLDDLMQTLEKADTRWPYSVAWIDAAAAGRALGRGVVTAGEHATAERVGRDDPFASSRALLVNSPSWVPNGLLNRASVRAFNEVVYRKAPRRPRTSVQALATFFHPLDVVGGWNRMYGSRGFVQYQFAVPFASGDLVREVLEGLQANRTPSFLGVLKRFGAGSPGHLSFPQQGWTLALDIPAGGSGLAELLDRFDRRVADEGGRIYLAKDGRTDPNLIQRFYPRLAEFRELKAQVDPDGLFTSDLARRLSL
jgi:decaprenylphospho-beta-D-ribofuranose 2-oxidase